MLNLDWNSISLLWNTTDTSFFTGFCTLLVHPPLCLCCLMSFDSLLRPPLDCASLATLPSPLVWFSILYEPCYLCTVCKDQRQGMLRSFHRRGVAKRARIKKREEEGSNGEICGHILWEGTWVPIDVFLACFLARGAVPGERLGRAEWWCVELTS